MIGKLVKVVWLDAHGSAANAAYELEEIPHAPVEVVSYGILLKDDEVGVSIASETCDKTVYRGYSFMPRLMVVSVELASGRGRSRPRRRPSPRPATPTLPPATPPDPESN